MFCTAAHCAVCGEGEGGALVGEEGGAVGAVWGVLRVDGGGYSGGHETHAGDGMTKESVEGSFLRLKVLKVEGTQSVCSTFRSGASMQGRRAFSLDCVPYAYNGSVGFAMVD